MSTELKTILANIADGVTLNPSAAAVTFGADSELTGVCEVDVRIGDHAVTVDEPAKLGGGGVAPNPVEYALLALGSCLAITYRSTLDRDRACSWPTEPLSSGPDEGTQRFSARHTLPAHELRAQNDLLTS